MTINDTLSIFTPATNVAPNQILASITPPAGYIQVDCYTSLTGSGATSADNFNMGVYVGGVLKAVLMNIQSSANTNATPQTHFYTVDGNTAIEIRVINAPGAITVTYNAKLCCTRKGMGQF